MVDTYAKCGLFEEAEAVVDMLPDPSIIFQTALMAGQLEQWHPEKELQCFEQLKFHGNFS